MGAGARPATSPPNGTRNISPCGNRTIRARNRSSAALLYARYGKGVYIFSPYVWFRELPAGVPGAYRIFANFLSAGKVAH